MQLQIVLHQLLYRCERSTYRNCLISRIINYATVIAAAICGEMVFFSILFYKGFVLFYSRFPAVSYLYDSILP